MNFHAVATGLLALAFSGPAFAVPLQEIERPGTTSLVTESSQTEGGEAPVSPPDETDPPADSAEEAETSEEGAEEEVSAESRETKSGYDEIGKASGSKGVEADLLRDNLVKNPVFKFLENRVEPLYDFKDRLNGLWGIAFGVDYNFLNQYASFSFTDDQATSGAVRFYGTWSMFGSKEKVQGNLVFRIEDRHNIDSGITPRDLGFDAGSALSTASFKDFNGGVTGLYWSQLLANERFAFVFGQMDPGDFMDAYPLLSAWTYFGSDAFFNNPTQALPQQGIGFVTRLYLTKHYYFANGTHDARADADGLDFDEFFDGEDLFYWWEVGWSPSNRSSPGDSIHVTYWEQDSLEDLGLERSRGWAFSFAPTLFGRYQPFVRAGYSEGNAALMRKIFAAGLGIQFRGGNDYLGFAVSWGAPVEKEAGTQMTNEVFHRIQLTEHLQVSPALQVTFSPSFNEEESAIFVGSVLRMRIAF